MDADRQSAMRKLGRLAGKIRLGFSHGLRGIPESGDEVRSPKPEDGFRKVIVRRTTIEEIEFHDPERR